MDELSRGAESRNLSEPHAMPLDRELARLIEVVWACEAAARREDLIDAAIRYGR